VVEASDLRTLDFTLTRYWTSSPNDSRLMGRKTASETGTARYDAQGQGVRRRATPLAAVPAGPRVRVRVRVTHKVTIHKVAMC
jgi:hypothetical protein